MLTDLAIDDGSFAWKLCMDIICLSFDGNLADATLIAAMGALMRLQLPGTRRIDDEIFVTEGEGTMQYSSGDEHASVASMKLLWASAHKDSIKALHSTPSSQLFGVGMFSSSLAT